MKRKLAKKVIFYLSIILANPIISFAQKEGGSNVLSPGQIWNEIAISQQTSTKFVTQLDLQWSGSDDIKGGFNLGKYNINYGARIWQHYYPKPHIKLSGFVGYWINPDQPEINQVKNEEYRLAIQGQYLIRKEKIYFYNRARYEARYFIPDLSNGNLMEHRLRYMPKLLYVINKPSLQKSAVYGLLSNELFMTIHEGYFWDQNRLTAGLGFYFNDHLTLELAYVNRFISKQSASNEFTHALSVSLGINDLFGK